MNFPCRCKTGMPCYGLISMMMGNWTSSLPVVLSAAPCDYIRRALLIMWMKSSMLAKKKPPRQTRSLKIFYPSSGITKNGCSARHASWVDFNMDGLLDLFINCEDVGNVQGEYPNKLYQQDMQQQFVDVATQSGLAVLDNNIIDYEWFDADNDADMDLFAHQDDGFYLYRNNTGRFESEFIYRGKFARIDKPEIKGASGAYWIFDGKLSVSDYDGDGDFDVFSSSKKGNALLVNNEGSYEFLDPVTAVCRLIAFPQHGSIMTTTAYRTCTQFRQGSSDSTRTGHLTRQISLSCPLTPIWPR